MAVREFARRLRTEGDLRLGVIWGSIVVVVAVFVLARCAVQDSGPFTAPGVMAAMSMPDGVPTVLLYDCPDYRIDTVSVTRESFSLPDVAKGWTVHRTDTAVIESLTPFAEPPRAGWTEKDDGTLKGFTPGQQYELLAYPSAEGEFDDFVFTLADLQRLQPGQVLVGVPQHNAVVTEDKFRATAKKNCIT